MDETHDLIERARRTAEIARQVTAESQRLVRASREIQHWTARVQGRVGGETGRFAFNRTSNHLLGLLPAHEFEHLAPQLQGVAFTHKQILQSATSALEYVYFPISGLLSATIVMQDGGGIEIAAIGSEGMVGLPVFVGSDNSPNQVVVQIPGNALRMDVSAFQAHVRHSERFRQILIAYHRACDFQNSYQIACNGLHSVEKRCCRQLLNIQDRIASDVIPLTHESLALSLGVRRPSVTQELAALQMRGAIDMRRGQIKIVHRPRLQSLACECYQAVAQEFSRLVRFVEDND